MPNLERLAASGTVFNHSYSAHPLCCPSRVSFWTGQYSSVHGSRHNQKLMSDGTPNLAESFRQAGYQLGIFGKNHCFTPRQLEQWFQTDYSMGSASWKAAILPGTARTVAAHGRWLREQGGPLLPPASAPFPYETFPTHMATQHAINYIERQAGEAFLMWLSLPDPHPPMDVPEKFANVLPAQSLKLPPSRKDEMEGKNTRMKIFDYLIRGREIPDEYLSRYLSIYSGKTAFVDYELGRLMDALQAKGLRENTIFLFTSDNGDFAGEHHLIVKTGSMVDSMVRMPAILSWPGSLPGGRREDALTNHVDFLPTLLNLCGLPALRTAQGMPLPLKTDSRRRQFVNSEYGSGDPEYTWAEARTLGPAARLGDYALTKPSVVTSNPAKRGHRKTGQWRTRQDNSSYSPNRPRASRSPGYGFRPSTGTAAAVLVRQLLGPHCRTWPWCSSRSSIELTAAVSPSNFPQSSMGRFDVNSVLARS